MKYALHFLLTSTLGSLLVIACTKPNDNAGDAQAVVESYLVAGQPVQASISIESITGTVDTLEPLEDISVEVTANGISYPLIHQGNGVYRNTSLLATEGTAYTLKFTYNGEEVTSSTKVPDRPTSFTASATTITAPTPPSAGTIPTMPDPVTFSWDNPSQYYHLMVVHCIQPDPVEINSGAVLLGDGTFRTEPTQENTQDLTPMRFKYYGLHEVILYRILPEYAALYEDNGTNSTNLTNPPGNITNGLGIFTGVNVADTLFITVE